MSWKNLKIGRKLTIGFGVILVLFAVASFSNYRSFGSIKEHIGETQEANGNKTLMVEKEVDHLNWALKLQELFANDEVNSVTVQTDDHKCAFGKWLYSEETQQMGAKDPALGQMLKAIEEPHHQLHESAKEIASTYVDFDMNLKTLLADRWIDHLSWTTDLMNSIMTKSKFSGGVDPHKCAFGHWYYGYEATNPTFAELLKKWETPHIHLHESAARIVAEENKGNYAAAQKIFNEETLPALKVLHGAYNDSRSWIDDMAARQQKAQHIYTDKTEKSLEETKGKLLALVNHFNSTAEKATEEMHGGISSATKTMLALALLGIVVGIVAAWIITKGISKPVSQMAEVAESIATGDVNHSIDVESKDEIGALASSFRNLIDYMKGLAGAAESIADNDLTVRVEPKSEKDVLGNSFKTMIANLTTMIRQLADNATQLVSAANEISSSSEQMSKGAQDQATQVNQVSSAVEEMTASILEAAKNAGDATDASRNASETATTGGTVVGDTIGGMQRINKVVRESAESIGKLAKSADQIGEIVSVIDDIADQTNLLALNAAIEAARAGEQGRGFAVVADEVRKLAERTGKATGEITDMIKGIQQETGDAVNSMESGLQEVDKGRELADKAGTSLNEIVNMSQRVMDMVTQIAAASEEQSAAAEQISKNIEHISSVTKETASGAEQSAAAAEELNRQAEGLQQMVAQFKLADHV